MYNITYIGESPTYILNEDTKLVMRAIGVSHTACKDEFRRNLRSRSWSVFSFFYNIYIRRIWVTEPRHSDIISAKKRYTLIVARVGRITMTVLPPPFSKWFGGLRARCGSLHGQIMLLYRKFVSLYRCLLTQSSSLY